MKFTNQQRGNAREGQGKGRGGGRTRHRRRHVYQAPRRLQAIMNARSKQFDVFEVGHEGATLGLVKTGVMNDKLAKDMRVKIPWVWSL